jgi:mannosyltransferase
MKVSEDLKKNYLLFGILFIGSLLRFYKIDFQSIWLDEIHTMNETNPKLSFLEVYDAIRNAEQMPPLYFYSVFLCFKIFSYTSYIARLFSVFAGIASIYAIYIFAKEILNKETGLIASLLLSVNIFHLYYSQEARPYALLLLLTICSFYRLVKYIKFPNRLNAIYYGIFSGAMLLTHFFGLFVLLSQIFILAIIFISIERKARNLFFINTVISGAIILGLFLPAIRIFIKVSEIKEFWIPQTDLKTIKQIYKDFCGNSDFILILAVIAILYYFADFILKIRLSRIKFNYERIVGNKQLLSFVVLISWIIIVLLIPIIRSYLVVPMIISRYFIVLLPPLIILISVAISACRIAVIRHGFVFLFVMGSLYLIFFQNKYYSSTCKSQFRETTQFIVQNNLNKEPVVSSLAWYLTYFLDNGKSNIEIIDKTLDNYIQEMQNNSIPTKSFWYMDAHGREYNPNKQTSDFLKNNFFVENSYDGFQAWTKHFVLIKDLPETVDISKFSTLVKNNGDSFNYYIEKYKYEHNNLDVTGWAYFEKQVATSTKIYILLIKDNVAHRLIFQKETRPDVTTYFKSEFDLSNSGYNLSIDLSSFSAGKYKLGLYLINPETKKEGLVLLDKIIQID